MFPVVKADLFGFMTEVFAKLADRLTVLDNILLILLFSSWFLTYMVVKGLWTSANNRLDKLENDNEKAIDKVIHSIDKQTEVNQKSANAFNDLTLEIVRVVTILEERRK